MARRHAEHEEFGFNNAREICKTREEKMRIKVSLN